VRDPWAIQTALFKSFGVSVSSLYTLLTTATKNVLPAEHIAFEEEAMPVEFGTGCCFPACLFQGLCVVP
jgi:hypothetical protein